jgi:AraC-like DNA-binding protein
VESRLNTRPIVKRLAAIRERSGSRGAPFRGILSSSKVFRRSAWRKRTFVAIFLSTLLISLVILSTSSIIYYRNLEQITVEQVTKSNIESLSRTRSVFAAIHLWVVSTVREIRNDPDVDRMLVQTSFAQNDVQRALNSMNNTIRFYPWIDSIYIYNQRADLVVSTREGVEQPPYSDLDIMQMLLNPVRPDPYRYLPRVIRSDEFAADGTRIPSAGRTNVLTIILDNVEDQPVEPSAWLVVNLAEEEIRADFLSRFVTDAEDFFVIQKNGIVISHPDTSLFRLDISNRALVGRILSKPEDEGSFVLSIGGTPRVVSYVSYSELDWYLVSIQPYADIMQPVVRVRRLNLLIFSGFVVLAGALAFIFSRRIYSPIERLLGVAVKMRGELDLDARDQEPPSRNELQFLSEMFRRVVDQASQLSLAQERYESAHLQEMFRQLLDGRVESGLVQHANTAQFLRQDDSFTVLVIRLDNYARMIREFRSVEIRTIFRKLDGFIGEFVPYDHYLVDMNEDHAALVTGFGASDNEAAVLDTLVRQVEEMQQEFTLRFRWSLSVGVSEIVHDADDLPDAYRDAFEATKQRFRIGHGCVVRSTLHVAEEDPKTYLFPEEAVRTMLYNVKKGELTAALHLLSEVFDEVMEHTYEDFSVLVQFTKYMSLKMLFSGRSAAISNQNESLRLIESIDSVETVVQAKELLSNAYRFFTAGLEASHSQEIVDLVTTIKTRVLKSLDDPNLSPDLVATWVNLSTNHVRRVFKDYTGISLSVFITNERIAVCKDLLVSTDLTVKEIFRRAGFSNYSNFFTTFKRLAGQTPGDYRTLHQASS